MPTNHVVRQGESLESIAHDHGFFDFRTIYRDELNAPLRELRPDPNLLFPGDVVVIPDRQPRTEVASTERTHRFAVRGRRVMLRIFLRDELGKPMEGVPYDLEVDGRILAQGKPTGAGGLVEEQIAPGARRGTLTIPDQTWTFLIAGLNPIEKTPDDGISGVQGRLWNLGYDTGPIDGILGPRTRGALRQFQLDQQLTATGQADAATRERLVKIHGC